MGDPGWSNYQASVDALIEHSGYLDLVARASGPQQHVGGAPGYHLRISSTGNWSLFRENTNQSDVTLASGTTSYGLNRWITLGIEGSGKYYSSFDQQQGSCYCKQHYLRKRAGRATGEQMG